MTEILAVVALAALFVLYGLMHRGRSRSCGDGCSCSLLSRGCDRGQTQPPTAESEHVEH